MMRIDRAGPVENDVFAKTLRMPADVLRMLRVIAIHNVINPLVPHFNIVKLGYAGVYLSRRLTGELIR